jgi:hypothetical protein
MRAHRFPGSSLIERVTYDADRGTLSIRFRHGGCYVYDAVPQSVFDAFCLASSAGAFFNEHVRHGYAFRRDPARRRFGPERG